MQALSRFSLVVTLLLLAAMNGPAGAQVTFEEIGIGLVTDISDDGTVATGITGVSWEVFRWTEADGIVPLGRVAPAQAGTPDISEDGSRISGTIASEGEGLAVPGLWIEGQGWTELMPPLPPDGGQIDSGYGSQWGMSGDGRTLVGLYWRPGATDGVAHAFSWHSTTGLVGLGSGGNHGSIGGGLFHNGGNVGEIGVHLFGGSRDGIGFFGDVLDALGHLLGDGRQFGGR